MDIESELLYDHSTVSGQFRRFLKKITWGKTLAAIPVIVLFCLGVAYLARGSGDGGQGSQNGVHLLLEAGMSPEQTLLCAKRQVRVYEAKVANQLKFCSNGEFYHLVSDIDYEKGLRDPQKDEAGNYIEDHVIGPVCRFLDTTKCRRLANLQISCVSQEAQEKLGSYTEILYATLCGVDKANLIASIYDLGWDCLYDYPTRVADCITKTLKVSSGPKGPQIVSSDQYACGAITTIQECLYSGILTCSPNIPTLFNSTFERVQEWIGSTCKTPILGRGFVV